STVSGSAGDGHRVDARRCGGCRVSGAQRVSRDPGLGDSCDVGVVLLVDVGCCGAGLDDAGDRAVRQCGVADTGVVVDPREQRTPNPQLPTASFEPCFECEDRARLGVGPEWDADEVSSPGLVGLRAADLQQQAGALTGDVVRGEGCELAATQCGGKPEEEDRTVTLAG